jgi:hypothetical protein
MIFASSPWVPSRGYVLLVIFCWASLSVEVVRRAQTSVLMTTF